jgi:hypothetical protein
MSKYNQSYFHPTPKPRPWLVHPIWRGIGFVFLFLFPVLSYAGSVMLVRLNFKHGWLPLPYELMNSLLIPHLGRVYMVDLMGALAILIISFALTTLVYAFVFRVAGPPRYTPLNLPPVRRRRRREE